MTPVSSVAEGRRAPSAGPSAASPRGILFPSAYVWAFFALLVAFFELQRLGLLLRHWGYFSSSAPPESLGWAFLYGLRLDAAVAAYLMSPPLVAALLMTLLGFGHVALRRWLGGLMLVLFALVAFAGWGELEFFRYFRDRYSAMAVEYLDTPGIVWDTIWARYHPLSVLALAAASWVLFRKALTFAGRRLEASVSRGRDSLALILSAGLALLIMRGGWGLLPNHWGSAYFSPHTASNQLALNGLFSLAADVRYVKRDTELWKKVESFFPPGKALERSRSLLLNPHERILETGEGLLMKSVPPASPRLLSVDRPNIVILLMESFSAQTVGAMGGPLASTPEFDRLAGQGVLFTRYFSQGERTGRALFSVLTGMPSPPGTPVMKTAAGRRPYVTLASVLKEAGYRSRFVYGGDLNFDNMDGFLRHNGFDEIMGLESFPGGRLWQWRTKWGVPDHIVLDRVHDLLSTPGPPSLSVVLTLSNHPPYKLPSEAQRPYQGPWAEERNAVHYADWSLGRFMEKARKSSYFKRTLFVLVGDHAQFYESLPASEITPFHVPCLFYGPEVLAKAAARIDAVSGHTDLAPTLTGLLGRSFRHSFWGRDLFHDLPSPPRLLVASRHFLYLIEDGLVVKDDPLGRPALYSYSEPDRLEPLPTPEDGHPLLQKGRFLTQTLRLLTRPQPAAR